MSERVWLVKMVSDDTVCSVHGTEASAEAFRHSSLGLPSEYYVQCWTVIGSDLATQREGSTPNE